jgi:hypothetical protein
MSKKASRIHILLNNTIKMRTGIAQLVQQLDGKPGGQSLRPSRVENFHVPILSRPALWPTQPPIYWVLVVHLFGVWQPGHKVDQSPPVSVKAKEMWVYMSICLHGIVLN